MKLDISEINHNYITRLIVFSAFLFKHYRKNESEYQRMVSEYLRKKTRLTIDIKITCGPKYTLQEQREKSIENLLSNDEHEILNLVVIQFKTTYKEVNLQININDEEKFESYLYS